MDLKEKIEIVKNYKDSFIASLERWLDYAYPTLEEKGKDKSFNKEEYSSIIEDSENLRRKLLMEDFDLSLKEINKLALVQVFIISLWRKNIEATKIAIKETEKIIKDLMS